MEQIEADFDGKMYGHLKVALAEVVIETLKPVQARHKDLMANRDHLTDLMQKGAQRARERATKTILAVYGKLGII